MHLNDVDLARRLLAGDPTVLDELYVDFWPVMSWRIRSRFPGQLSTDDLDDLGQDTFLRAWCNRATYDPDLGSVAAWIASIANLPDCNAGPMSYGGGRGLYTARSNHPGGVNAVMADGSARFVADGIDVALWRALSTREGHEALDTSF